MGAHTHPATFFVQPLDGTASSPSADFILGQVYDATNKAPINGFAVPQAANVAMSPSGVSLGAAGSSQPLDIRQPFLGMMYIICVLGLYPPQS
jgi:microcystin-dependent protein